LFIEMLLPTYDVFDETPLLDPAESQSCFRSRKEFALTICEDAWNDKHFWHRACTA